MLEEGFDVIDSIAGTGNFVTGSVHIHHETGRCYANQYQHDQTNAFLPVVCAMRERHADCGEDQCDTRPEWRLFLAVFLFTLCWRQVNTGTFFSTAPVATQQKDQAACNHQADNRRDDKRGKNTYHFRDVKCIHDRCAVHQRIG
ncbi:hypothetical protein D3C81_1865710 [compost metagenome]